MSLRSDQGLAALQTPAAFIRWGAEQFDEQGLVYGHGTVDASQEAAVLVLHALGLPHDVEARHLESALTEPQQQAVRTILLRRIRERKPSAYLTGEAWFAGLRFQVDERVIVPRSPIAEWIERGFSPWLEAERVRGVLELGCGSGCIAIACGCVFSNAHVVAVDISSDALDVARQNVRRHQMSDRVRLLESDLFDAVDGSFDLIVSNPPYVDEAELAAIPREYRHEPLCALAGGADGLYHVRRILLEARRYMIAEGILVVEVGNSREALVEEFPTLPFVWLDLERGGENVFLLDAADLP